MSDHDWLDLGFVLALVWNLTTVFWLLGQRDYWKRIALLHENARCDAQSRERCLMQACDALRRALGKLELEREGYEVDSGAVIKRRDTSA